MPLFRIFAVFAVLAPFALSSQASAQSALDRSTVAANRLVAACTAGGDCTALVNQYVATWRGQVSTGILDTQLTEIVRQLTNSIVGGSVNSRSTGLSMVSAVRTLGQNIQGGERVGQFNEIASILEASIPATDPSPVVQVPDLPTLSPPPTPELDIETAAGVPGSAQ